MGGKLGGLSRHRLQAHEAEQIRLFLIERVGRSTVQYVIQPYGTVDEIELAAMLVAQPRSLLNINVDE